MFRSCGDGADDGKKRIWHYDFIRPGANGSYDGTCDSTSGQCTGILQWTVLAQRQSGSGNDPVCRLLLQCSERKAFLNR